MRRSETLLFTSREDNSAENETARLLYRAGLIRQFGSGLYALTPTGQRVKENILACIEREMDAIGGQKLSLPALNGSDIWKQSGRWESFAGEMFTLSNRDETDLCLAPSHEEGIVHLVDGEIRSYEDLPLLFYQVESKYRDDHARNGLVRMKEFTMKDAYSLHVSQESERIEDSSRESEEERPTSEESLQATYEAVRDAYVRLFETLGIEFVVAAADNSVMGGSTSEEFIALADTGTLEVRSCTTDGCRSAVTDESPHDDRWTREICTECGGQLTTGEGIEIGHTFQLGTRYSEAMGLTIDTATGGEQTVVMGSYGIGIERLIHSLVEQHSDDRGCRWSHDTPCEVAPFDVAIVPLEYEGEMRETADRLYERCGRDRTLLFDDRGQSIGERFAESDLLGIPWKLVLGNHFDDTGEIELERRDGQTRYASVEEVHTLVE